MMLVGTSFGGCIKSLLKDEVNINDVLVIITRTAAKDLDSLLRVLEEYHKSGNGFATLPDNYDISDMDLDKAKSITTSLYQHGKIHQPRLFNGFGGFVHIEMSRNEIWIPLAPSPKTDDERVVDAYEKYKLLNNLLS